MRSLRSGLSREDIAARKNFIGASDAITLMSGDSEKVHRLWEEKTGRREREDLSGLLRVVMGQHTEELNRYWYEKQTERAVTDAGVRRTKKGLPWMAATLDGITLTEAGHSAVFEAKHVGPWSYSREKVAQFYLPQLTHAASVIGVRHAVLSILICNDRWEYCEIEVDPFYENALIEAERKFWDAVKSDMPPDIGSPPTAPVLPGELVELDMTGSNEWGEHAAAYLETLPYVEKNESAVAQLKALVPAHARACWGNGVRIARDKRNSLRIGSY
jgi:predicted phage-related endonuclease